MSDEELTEQEKAELQAYLGTNAPVAPGKDNLHTFLQKVITEPNTTKLGYLKDEEVGTPRWPVRTDKGLALISREIMNNSFYADFFDKQANITTDTSLSRDGFLLKLATIQRRQVEDVTKKKSENKSWFKKKEPEAGLTP